MKALADTINESNWCQGAFEIDGRLCLLGHIKQKHGIAPREGVLMTSKGAMRDCRALEAALGVGPNFSLSECDGEVSCPAGKLQIACLKRAIEIVKAKGEK